MTFDLIHTEDSSLEKFLSRPNVLFRYEWFVSSTLDESFPGLVTLLSDPRIANRVNNYAYISGTMHIKVTTTGTSFHYGKGVVSYEPWPDQSTNRQISTPISVRQKFMLPHACFDPSTSEGCELSYPLIHPFNAVSLPEVNSITDSTDQIYVFSPFELRQLGDIDMPLEVVVYGWMTDVKLYMPTVAPMGVLSEQSGEMQESNVQKVLSTLISGATTASTVPLFKPYAIASEMVLRGVKGLATLFGFSRPSVISETRRAVLQVLGDLNTYNIADNSSKLTVDSKQEVTVDPRVVGMPNDDELTVVSLGKREFFLHGFDWTFEAAGAKTLFRSGITPMYTNRQENSDRWEISPSALAAAPFRYWRGTVYMRIEIVASAFHRGKLRIAYDPIRSNFSSDLRKYNVQYSNIIDLSKTRNYEFCIGWGTNRPFLETTKLDQEVWTNSENQLPLSANSSNGFMAIEVIAPLVSVNSLPTSTEGVKILIFTRMGDDFEVAGPTIRNIDAWTPIVPTSSSSIEVQNGLPIQVTDEQSGQLSVAPSGIAMSEEAPVDLCINQVPEQYDSGWLASTHFGERIVSIRQILKRYCYHSSFSSNNSVTGLRLWKYTLADFPFYAGKFFDAAGPDGENICRVTFLNWFTPCFLARRGSLRHKITFWNSNPAPNTISVHLNEPGVGISVTNQPLVGTPSLDARKARLLTAANTIYGAVVSNARVYPSLEYETPYYHNGRFMFGTRLNVNQSTGIAIQKTGFHTISHDSVNSGNATLIDRYVAAGDDFQLHFFKYTPLLVRNVV
ncbi:hypothetical protein 2 [Sanxia picorna-like virus 2]|uniref:hypothetical protein 2 n=1 Tax=Sanxia picorna-like virus 2 TaxID=1923371 RepID=UPI00090BAC59|nr:hypothetical protein 2 [Sanxia picorna-like virus 2]APG77467.1 hypothetical protein 2 [Sanxia picorna-like virus 2]